MSPCCALLRRSPIRSAADVLAWFICSRVIKMLVVFTVIMVGVALLTLIERKVSRVDAGPPRPEPGRRPPGCCSPSPTA